jgi:flavin-dependent dehydrogenase
LDAQAVFRVGDQLAVIASFTGDGMSMALRSAAEMAASMGAGESAFTYHARMRRQFAPQMRLAARLYGLGKTRLGQTMLVAAARIWPALLRAMAGATRVAD